MSELGKIPESLPDKLNCSICLEIFTLPLSLPCGHNFCQRCIHEYWDKQGVQMTFYDCPVCREKFEKRPEPMKNVDLCEIVQYVKEMRHLGAPFRSENKTEDLRETCPRHNRELSMFCCTEKRCICQECIVKGCKGHELELIETETQKEKKRLSEVLLANSNNRKQTEGKIANLDQTVENIKASCDKTVSGISSQFDQLKEMLNVSFNLAIESMRNEEKVVLGQAQTNRYHLQRHLEALQQYKKEADQLLQNPDNVAFLQGLPNIVSPGSAPVLEDLPPCGTSQLNAVTTILPEITKLLKVNLPNAIFPAMPQAGSEESQPSTSPAKPLARDSHVMSELREQMYQDYRNLTFDPKSAYKYIQLSCQNMKADHKSNIPQTAMPDSPKRFRTWQVFCSEGFSEGHHYWEVEISQFFVRVGIAYSGLPRTNDERSEIGRNQFSWSLNVLSTRHSAWHDNQEQRLHKSQYRKIGISLDITAGSLTFYGVKYGGLEHIYSFTCIFTNTLYPVFWIGEDTVVKLCHKT
ncbi:E3 ubiquitin-protein ligase TRIM65-like isoform X1 [Pelobates fuscus]|uniref:E3 ubiquitin-protein ligase TRIM65-like isoform X1 n=1 Tax=Pelobates fuscus TaxID=191477 RepID=UPI002FE42F75